MKPFKAALRILALMVLIALGAQGLSMLYASQVQAQGGQNSPAAQAASTPTVWSDHVKVTGQADHVWEGTIIGRTTLNCTTYPWVCTDQLTVSTEQKVECDADFTAVVDTKNFTFAQHWFLEPGDHAVKITHPMNSGAFSCMEPTSTMNVTPTDGWSDVVSLTGEGGAAWNQTIYGRQTWSCTTLSWLCGKEVTLTSEKNLVCDADFSIVVDGAADAIPFGQKFPLNAGSHKLVLSHPSNAGAFSCEQPLQ